MNKRSYPKIWLKSGREYSARCGHPWIFSGAIERKEDVQDGDTVEVLSRDGEFVAIGHYFDSSIAVKILSLAHCAVDAEFWGRKLRSALDLRSRLGLVGSARTTAWRLVNAEGDGLPGLIIDIYNSTAVLQLQSSAMARGRESIVGALSELLGESLEAVYCRAEKSGGTGEYLVGRKFDDVVFENDLKFKVDWEHGQKTGFFLDQRDNRAAVGALAADLSVLNCFSYTGAFSVYSLHGGASHVTSVDSSNTVAAPLGENLALNGIEASRHTFVSADCLQYLHEVADQFDFIILDPPAFVKHKGAMSGGIKGYETINSLALRSVRPSGLVATFSCSQLVTREIFRDTVRKAAVRSGREIQIVSELHQSACHPIAIGHPEGEYLKGLILRVR